VLGEKEEERVCPPAAFREERSIHLSDFNNGRRKILFF